MRTITQHLQKPCILAVTADETPQQKYARLNKKKCLDCDKMVHRDSKRCRSCHGKHHASTATKNLVAFPGSSNPRYVNGRRMYHKLIDTSSCEVCTSRRYVEVHHIDGDRDNNEVDNLQALCRSCHFKLHHTNPKRDDKGRFA